MMAVVVLVSLVLEAAVGYPAALQAWIAHPVVWAGGAISGLERGWNRPGYSFATRRALGGVAVVLVAGIAAVLGGVVQAGVWGVARALAGGSGAASEVFVASAVAVLLIAAVGTVGLAQRSLFDHVRDVFVPLEKGDLPLSRQRVSLIVGRDTQRLDANGVAAAALESLAESFNDGIVAPAFWFVIAGLPGLFVYKVLNTADSLIGHKEQRWRAFGWAAARADDVANLVPARIAGVLLVLAGSGGWDIMLRDASKHASPNAGWPEAAMAGALGVRLGGATSYEGVVHERPVFGSGPAPGVTDLQRGLRVYVIACGLLWLTIAAVAVLVRLAS